MEKRNCINGGAQGASPEGMLAVQQFLQDNYHFRRNMLNGKVEFSILPEGNDDAEKELDWRPLTPEALNSIIIRAKREQICEKGSPKTDIMEYVHSEEIETHDPIVKFLKGLPTWDGQNHVARLFRRLPGISTEQLNYLTIWLRSAVAHWLQMDTLHGNECVPTLIGAQGCGKTTFIRRLLPQELRQYYLDHLNLSNKFDKEMALTNNLLVNLDELEAIRPSQHAALKQTLSKSKVNGRPIYGCAQEDRPRYASFVSTTNNPHPLTDATGNRRYICVRIPAGQYIDNSGEIDYGQLYAQVLYEIRELKSPYWFNNDEVARIQEMNLEFMERRDVTDAITVCFRKPEEGEAFKRMKSSQVLEVLRNEFPSIPNTLKMAADVGVALNTLGYEFKEHGHVKFYRVIPLKAA
ncbi:MAG: helicase [Prevotella sp.]|nr:helicase [Prevotella sp.]